jgi:taurine--2-oxoglutarate transaminase
MTTVSVESLAPPGPAVDADAVARTYADDRAHVFHSWSAQGALDPMVVTAAQGSWVWDGEGRPLLDFSSQLVNTNIGHQHPAVVAAIREQAELLCTIAPQHANAARSQAARLIAERAPGDQLNHVFFTERWRRGQRARGADGPAAHRPAQGAVSVPQLPRRHEPGCQPHRRPTAVGQRRRRRRGSCTSSGPYTYRSAFHAEDDEQESARALEHLEQVVQLEGPATIAAIVLETVPGTAGIMVPPPGYLAGVRDICDRYGICWIADEVMCGFGRTGAWFAVEHFNDGRGIPTPDLITFAKGVNSGYVPLGGVIVPDAIYETFRERVYPGGLTYSGHPLACAAASATITAMTDEGIVDNAARIGADVIGPGSPSCSSGTR